MMKTSTQIFRQSSIDNAYVGIYYLQRIPWSAVHITVP